MADFSYIWTSQAIITQFKQACKEYIAAEIKAFNLQESKGKGLEDSKAVGDTNVFLVVPIGGAIIHPY